MFLIALKGTKFNQFPPKFPVVKTPRLPFCSFTPAKLQKGGLFFSSDFCDTPEKLIFVVEKSLKSH